MSRQALLLSGSLGAGHEMAAKACATSLAARGWDTETLDAMALLGPRGGSAGEAVFRTMLATPGLFDAFHAITSTRIPPTWPSRCSPPPHRRSACSPTATPG